MTTGVRILFCLLGAALAAPGLTARSWRPSFNLAQVASTASRPAGLASLARFESRIVGADFAARSDIAAAYTELEQEVAEMIAPLLELPPNERPLTLRRIEESRAMVRSSIAALLEAPEDNFGAARRRAQLALAALREALLPLTPTAVARQ